jgi:hypothetical protein
VRARSASTRGIGPARTPAMLGLTTNFRGHRVALALHGSASSATDREADRGEVLTHGPPKDLRPYSPSFENQQNLREEVFGLPVRFRFRDARS